MSFGPVLALDSVSFSVDAGSSAALIGPNGSGKTTLLHAVAGLQTPTAGTITFNGTFDGADIRIAYITQQHHTQWMPLTAREVLAMAGYARRGLVGRIKARDRDDQAAAADRMAVSHLLGRQYGELSRGQQQRVLLAQALAQRPDLLLLDEPITGLDLVSQQRILDVIAEETAEGTSVILSTHHLDEARHCDQVLLLATRLVTAGPPDEALTADHLREAFTGTLLGDHTGHDHPLDLLLLDDHGHGSSHA